MTQIFTKDQIEKTIQPRDIILCVEEGFRLLSQGKVVVAPISSLNIDNAGLAKIKYGYIRGEDNYVIKVGSFFPGNASKKLPAINASMQIYSQQTGEFVALLLDEAHLTNARTAAAGAVAVRCFAPSRITKVGIIGVGVQARWQLEYLEQITDCRSAMVWGRNSQATESYRAEIQKRGWSVEIADSPTNLAEKCNVIIVATSATQPVLGATDIQPGTLVVSVGADTDAKQELSADLLREADLVVADSKEQCQTLGNIAAAMREGAINEDAIVELGDCLENEVTRSAEDQIIVVNLTGVAVQDIQVANLAYRKLINLN